MRLVQWVLRHLRLVLLCCFFICGSECFLLWLGTPSVTGTDRLSNAIIGVANEIMTLTAPDQVGAPEKNKGVDNKYLKASRLLGWMVSLTGWLFIPSLIGMLAAKGQDLQNDELKLRLSIIDFLTDEGFTPAEAHKQADEFIAGIKRQR